MSISDKIIIMHGGVIAQMGTPEEIYYHPQSEFVADFIGEANFLMGDIVSVQGDNCVLAIGNHRVTVDNPSGFPVGKSCKVVLRPEAGVLAETGDLPCKVVLSCFMGAYQNYHVMVGNTLIKIADYCPVNKRIFEVDETAYLSFDADCVHILNAEA